MARKFKTSDIIDPAKAPLTKRSLEHLNSSFNELGEDIMKSIIGNYTANDIIIIRGCDVEITSGSIPGTGTATLSGGAVYYNGRVYRVDENNSLSTTSPQTLVWEIEETTVAGDPATFSNGLTYNFHIIEKFKLVAGTSGSGVANYDGSEVKKLFDQTNTGFSLVSTTNLSDTYVRGVANVHNGFVTYSLRVVGTTLSSSGFSWVINVPEKFKAVQQDSGGWGLNNLIGIRRTDDDVRVFSQNSDDAFSVTINSDNQINVLFGSDLSVGAAKTVEFVFQMTCRLK